MTAAFFIIINFPCICALSVLNPGRSAVLILQREQLDGSSQQATILLATTFNATKHVPLCAGGKVVTSHQLVSALCCDWPPVSVLITESLSEVCCGRNTFFVIVVLFFLYEMQLTKEELPCTGRIQESVFFMF